MLLVWLGILLMMVLAGTGAAASKATPSGPGVLNERAFKEKCKVTDAFDLPTRPQPRHLKHMRWVHTPKTGTSFGTTLVHYACPRLDDAVIPHPGFFNHSIAHGAYMKVVMRKYYNRKNCDSSVSLVVKGHSAYRGAERKGIVMMVRDPRRRHFSGWGTHGEKGEAQHPVDLNEYARFYRGCQTRMLVGVDCQIGRQHMNRLNSTAYWQPTAQQNRVALEALHDMHQIPFFGITDYWNESICLFHAMYGGDITSHEFQNVRPFKDRPTSPTYADVHLASDPYDWGFYKTARTIFISRLMQYGLQVPDELLEEYNEFTPDLVPDS